MKAIKEIPIYLTKKHNVRQIDVVQHDTGIQLVFSVLDFAIPSGASATLYVQKPSGKFVYQEEEITVAGNTVTVDLHNQAITEHGKVPYQVSLKDGYDVITTFTGLLMVEKSMKDAGATESKTVIKAFDEAVSDHVAEFQTTAEQIVQACIATIPADYTAMVAKVNESANAVKGYLSGAVVAADDVSLVEHNPAVKVKSKNHFNIANFSTEKDQSNGKTICAISADNLVIGRTYTVFSAVPLQWFKISNSATGYSCVGLQNDIAGFTSYTFTHQRHINIPESAPLYIYVNNLAKTAMYDTAIMESMGICIVEGSATTDYIPYIDPSTATVKRCGKNLFEVGERADYHVIGENTTVSGGVIRGEVLTSNSGHCINLKNKFHCGKHGISFNYSDTLPRILVRLYDNNGDVITSCDELGKVGFQYNDAYNAFFANTKAMVVDIPDSVAYWCLGFVFPVTSTAPVGTIVKASNVQVELSDEVTGYEAPDIIEHVPEADGTVPGITSLSPSMTILTDTEGVIVECEYNRDTNKVIGKLTNAITALGGTI